MGLMITRRAAILSLLLVTSFTHAQTPSIVKTKQSLNQLQTKILLLQQNLNHTQDKQTLLKQEMAKTEQKIKQGARQLQQIQQQIKAQDLKIKDLQQQVQTLQETLKNGQARLAQYIRTRYKINHSPLVSWLLTQDIRDIDHVLIYYQYMVRANKQFIDNLRQTQQTFVLKQTTLTQEMNALNTMHTKLEQDQRTLTENHHYRVALLHSLNQDIQQKHQTLESYRQNQANLAKLLTSLVQQSVLQAKHPLTYMKRKLINPVNVTVANRHKHNQGIVFNANEGTPVYAVSSGKVVFCNWLNGYGNLMIIDHGWGFMTLYANNLALLKQTGHMVNQGEQIAKVGHSGGLRENGLYFEIRHRGKAVSPLEWLK